MEKKKIQQKYDFYCCTHDIIITQNNHSSIVIKCRIKRNYHTRNQPKITTLAIKTKIAN